MTPTPTTRRPSSPSAARSPRCTAATTVCKPTYRYRPAESMMKTKIRPASILLIGPLSSWWTRHDRHGRVFPVQRRMLWYTKSHRAVGQGGGVPARICATGGPRCLAGSPNHAKCPEHRGGRSNIARSASCGRLHGTRGAGGEKSAKSFAEIARSCRRRHEATSPRSCQRSEEGSAGWWRGVRQLYSRWEKAQGPDAFQLDEASGHKAAWRATRPSASVDRIHSGGPAVR